MKVSLWRSSSRLARAVRAAGQRHDERPVLRLEVAHAGVVGVGEVSPQPENLNGDPGVAEVLEELENTVLPRLVRLVTREGEPPAWARASALVNERPASRVAGALLEMALLDRELRVRAEGVEQLWPAQFVTPRQETVSLVELGEAWRVASDTARVRVKTAPGALGREAIDRVAQLSVPVLLDFNASAGDADEVRRQVRALGEVARLDAVEQPFAPGNVVETARLAAVLGVDVSIDEGLRDENDLRQIVRYGAARVLCVKPARVGGFARARNLIGRASDLGLRVYLGGFFETPYARRANRLFAASCVSEPSDVADVARPGGASAPSAWNGVGLGPSERDAGARLVAEWS